MSPGQKSAAAAFVFCWTRPTRILAASDSRGRSAILTSTQLCHVPLATGAGHSPTAIGDNLRAVPVRESAALESPGGKIDVEAHAMLCL